MNKKRIIKFYLLGILSYLSGWIISYPFKLIRENTFLIPKVSLIAMGTGSLLLGYLYNLSNKKDLFRFSIISILTHAITIIASFLFSTSFSVIEDIKFLEEFINIFVPGIIYAVLFGLIYFGFKALIHFLMYSAIGILPFSIISAYYHTTNNISFELEGFWMLIGLGAAISLPLSILNIKEEIKTIKE